MKIIYNNILTFPGFKAINLFGFLFVRNGKTLRDIDINHEKIHTKQMKELLYIFFYLWYVIEWLIKLPIYSFTHKAYRNISFEREAYQNQYDMNYLDNRKHYNWIKKI